MADTDSERVTPTTSANGIAKVDVDTIDLSSRNVLLPCDRVGMVVAQPHLSLTAIEPFRCTVETKTQQLSVLDRTLSVSREARHGAPKTHFTIFPEYSIPGLDGIALIESALCSGDWPNGTIVIGGTDALTKADFVTLAQRQGTHLNTTANDLNRVAATEWINCGIIWIKAADGTVERWLQPKLHPAWPEQNVHYQNMFRGNSVFMFRGPLDNGTQYRFCSLMCFDWIARVHNHKPWQWIMEDLCKQATQVGAELSVSWFFVIQHNRKPSDDTFLTEVSGFFDQTNVPNVRRDRACLIFANSAGRAVPGRADFFGSTGLVFSKQTLFADPKCHPTFCNGGQRFRSSTLLSAHRDVLFRERGACIHSFSQVNPNSLNAGAAGKTIALENAFVFPLDGTTDPRAPGESVPACVKWWNDELDDLASLSAQYPAVALAGQVDTAHGQLLASLRAISPQSVAHAVNLAAMESKAEHADDWDRVESEALELLVHTLDIIALGFAQPTIGEDTAHATTIMNNQTVDLLAIRGKTHEACIEHSKCFLPLPRRQVLLVSRDSDNTAWCRRFGSILQPNDPLLGQEHNFTDPNGGSLHLGYEKLLNIFRSSPTAADLRGAINAELAA